MRDLRQTPEYGRYMEMLGWQVIEVNNELGIKNNVFIKKLPLLGNIGKLQRPEGKLNLKKLDAFAHKYGLVALFIEPSLDTRFAFNILRLTKAKSCFLPSKTIHIDLAQSEEKLFNRMKKDTRYSLRKAKEAGVKVVGSEDIQTFIKMWHHSARRRGMWLPQRKEILALWNAFGPKTQILFALNSQSKIQNSIPLAGVLLVRNKTTAYYMYAFSTKEGNSLSSPTLLAWEAIRFAKSPPVFDPEAQTRGAGGGCKLFDFEGIYDERYPQTKNWKGFTKFKEGFGGKIIIYPETLVRYYNPIVKFLI